MWRDPILSLLDQPWSWPNGKSPIPRLILLPAEAEVIDSRFSAYRAASTILQSYDFGEDVTEVMDFACGAGNLISSGSQENSC